MNYVFKGEKINGTTFMQNIAVNFLGETVSFGTQKIFKNIFSKVAIKDLYKGLKVPEIIKRNTYFMTISTNISDFLTNVFGVLVR